MISHCRFLLHLMVKHTSKRSVCFPDTQATEPAEIHLGAVEGHDVAGRLMLEIADQMSWASAAIFSITLWLFNIAMENGPFIDDFPIKTSIYGWFSMAILNNQMVRLSKLYSTSAIFSILFPQPWRFWMSRPLRLTHVSGPDALPLARG